METKICAVCGTTTKDYVLYQVDSMVEIGLGLVVCFKCIKENSQEDLNNICKEFYGEE